MKKLFLSTLLMALPLLASAYDCLVDGIYYNLNSEEKTAEVTYQKYENGTYYSDYSGSVVIPEKITYEGVEYSVTSIGDNAFSECSGLTSVTIPNSVTSIGKSAFYSTGLTSVHITDLAAWCNISFSFGFSNPLYYAHHLYLNGEEIKDLVIPNSVTSIGAWAFDCCTGLTSVTIPNSVTSIGIEVFRNCTSLSTVTIGNSLYSIGNNVFSGCYGLTSITVDIGNRKYDSRDNCNAIIETSTNRLIAGCKNTIIPNSVTSIGHGAFEGCSGLTSITIPNSITSIGSYAFSGCSGLTSITISNSVTSIERYSFYGCSSLTSIDIPNSVKSIGIFAFSYCTALTSVAIPNSVTSIGEKAFWYCTSLNSIIIPNNITIINSETFADCSSLTSVIIPNSVTYIGSGAFERCTSLTSSSIVIPNSVTRIATFAFFGCTSLDSFTIPNSVTSIGDSAFEYCSSLISIDIPNSMTTIGQHAFEGCSSLISITIPNSVTTISYSAFSGCTSLTSVISEMENPCKIDEKCFSEDVFKNSKLYVPKGTVDKYKSTDYWSKFVFIEESDPTDITQVSSDDLLISAQNGTINVRGEQNGLPLTVYTADGKMLGSATMKDGQASISTNLQRGEIAIVKVGTRSVKMLMK